ncbi:MAG: hypothetical protein IIB54_09490, partial [Planctomycetes bacterium]|nr:hypothetical protein [Planctomycetota bacterium]
MRANQMHNESPGKDADGARRSWADRFTFDRVKVLIVGRGPVRKEAIDIFAGLGTLPSGILLSEKEWTGSEFFQRGLKPYDLHYMAGLVAFRDDARIAQVECLRPKGKGRFSSRDLDTLRKFEPHFRRALQLNQKFWDTLSQHTAAIQILDTLKLGVILVDATCLPVYLNHYAEEILGEGTVIFLREQRLATTADHESQMLNDYLQGAASTGNGTGMS